MATERIATFSRGDLVFDVRDEGPLDGTPVVLLHGFPQDSRSWGKVAPLLNDRGYRTLAPDQRGYSPGARPSSRRAYRNQELVGDVVALIEQAGLGRVHLVGHDWGAAVAWAVATARPDLLRSLTALSVPHPAAFLRAIATSRQGLKSWYMFFFQLPWLPERAITNEVRARRLLRGGGLPPESAARDAAMISDPETARAALNWYRAMVFLNPGQVRSKVTVPTLHVWSDRDVAIGPQGSARTPSFVSGPYTYRVLEGVSHWIPEEVPERVDELLAEHFATTS